MTLTSKRHYPLLIVLALVLSILTVGIGSQRITAYSMPGTLSVVDDGVDITNTVALFDESVVHSIQILISDDDYEQMITTYRQTGEKDFFPADVIIDGVRMDDVGVRLKGNASLRTALGGMGTFGNGQEPGEGGNMPPFDPEDMPGFGGDGGMPQFDPENMPGLG